MPAFNRIFNQFPGYDVLENIESINVIDQTPQDVSLGDGVTVACVVGEFEDGPFNTPTRIFSSQDRLATFGGFGFTRNGVLYQNPVARRSAGSTANWEGNAYVNLARKVWGGLTLCRVDNTPGTVTFTRLASLVGNPGPYALTSGNTVTFSVNGGAGVTATFTGARATKAGSGGTFATGFLGGETLELILDYVPMVVTFTVAAQTAAQVVAEINSQTATDIAVVNAGQVDLRSVVAGTAGRIEVTGGTGRATIGQAIASASGTGNVANIGAVTRAEAIGLITVLTGIDADSTSDGRIRAKAVTTPGTGTISVTSMSATALGFPVATVVSATTGSGSVVIPAGTLLQDDTTLAYWVTAVSTTITNGAATAIPVRPATDDDSCPTAAVGDITIAVDTLPDGFSIANSLALSRLNGAQLDARYQTAIAATLGINESATRDIDVIGSARATATIGVALKENCVAATASGHRPRKYVFGPPVGTSRTNAKANTGIGVGNVGRTDRCSNYCFPGGTIQMPEIAALGAMGGTGFTDDGVIEVRTDLFYAAVRTRIPPEESAAQDLRNTAAGALPFLSMEDDYNSEVGGVGLTMDDYIDFKSNGICAIRFAASGAAGFQSDVTAVSPSVDPARVDANRRWMTDYIIRLTMAASEPFSNRLSKATIRRNWLGVINMLMDSLKAPNQPESSRIEDFKAVDVSSPEGLARGHGEVKLQAKLYSALKALTISIEAGPGVVIVQDFI